MAFQAILTFLILLGGCFLVWKFVISPRIPDEPNEPDHMKILEDKLEKLEEIRAEYESVREEKEVTTQLKEIDEDIENILREIKNIENG